MGLAVYICVVATKRFEPDFLRSRCLSAHTNQVAGCGAKKGAGAFFKASINSHAKFYVAYAAKRR